MHPLEYLEHVAAAFFCSHPRLWSGRYVCQPERCSRFAACLLAALTILECPQAIPIMWGTFPITYRHLQVRFRTSSRVSLVLPLETGGRTRRILLETHYLQA